MLPIPNRENYDGIQLITEDEFNKEVNLQKIIYRKSFTEPMFNSPFDGLCPAIVTQMPHMRVGVLNFITTIRNNLVARGGISHNGQARTKEYDMNEMNSIFDYTNPRINPDRAYNSYSVIAMELMTGYETVWEASRKHLITSKHETMIAYSFDQLHIMGYLHGDAHFGNMLINTNEDFFSAGNLGRVIIIDFGRTRPLTLVEKALTANGKNALETFGLGMPPPDRRPQWEYNLTKPKVDTLIAERQVKIAQLELKLNQYYPHPTPPGYNVYMFIQNLLDNNVQDHYFVRGGGSEENIKTTEEFREHLLNQLNINDDDSDMKYTPSVMKYTPSDMKYTPSDMKYTQGGYNKKRSTKKRSTKKTKRKNHGKKRKYITQIKRKKY